MAAEKRKARFFEPMLLLATSSLPEGEDWAYELKLDGYRAIAFKSNGRVHLRSRNNKDFALRYIRKMKRFMSWTAHFRSCWATSLLKRVWERSASVSKI